MPGLIAASTWTRRPLDAQVILGVLDPRDDPARDRQLGAAGGEAVGEDGLLEVGELGVGGQGGMGVEEGVVVELEHGQVDPGRPHDDLRGQLLARLIGLDIHLAGVVDHVADGEDPPARDHDARGGRLLRLAPGPRVERVRPAPGHQDLHHRLADVRIVGVIGPGGPGTGEHPDREGDTDPGEGPHASDLRCKPRGRHWTRTRV